MDWTQVLVIASSTIGACWLMHRENIKHHQETSNEMKDFHGRLCRLEEKYIQIMQKYWESK